jgi:hypothetical protein
MKFCPVVSEICHGHVDVARKERRIPVIIIIKKNKNIAGIVNHHCLSLFFIITHVCSAFY